MTYYLESEGIISNANDNRVKNVIAALGIFTKTIEGNLYLTKKLK